MNLNFNIFPITQENIVLVSKTDQIITSGHFHGCFLNGNRILTDHTFYSSGIWIVTIAGEKVFLDDFKISDKFELSKESVQCIIDSAKNSKI